MNIVAEVRQHLPETGTRYLLGLSGGVDSVVLLHILHQIKLSHPAIELRAMYVDHGLQDESAIWSHHCQAVCEQMRVSFLTQKVDVDRQSVGVEAAAREARYSALASECGSEEFLVTAHHQDDQAETVLLQIMRGAGVKGLAGMSVMRYCHGKILLRPMLGILREDIQRYAIDQGLSWVEDKSNVDVRYSRNHLRQKVIPLMRSRWSSFAPSLAKTADHCREANVLLSQLAQIDIERTSRSSRWLTSDFCLTLGCRSRLSLPQLRLLDLSRRANVLRHWLAGNGVQLPSQRMMKTIDDLLMNDRSDHVGRVVLSCVPGWKSGDGSVDGCCENRAKIILWSWDDGFYLGFDVAHCDAVLPWNLTDDLILPEPLEGRITKEEVLPYLSSDVDLGGLEIRFRCGGEVVQLMDESFHRSLKQCFQMWRIPPWYRHCVPLLYYRDELILVVGFPFRGKKHE